MDKKRLVIALCIAATAALTGCAARGGGKVVLKTDKIYPPIGRRG